MFFAEKVKHMNTLEIRNLTKTYPNDVKALDNISLTISKGMFGLLGPNGAGKSSLMRTIATLQEPDEGEVFFKNVNIHNDQDFLRKQLGYLPQDFGVYPKISAFQLLNHLAVLKGMVSKNERDEQVNALLQQTNLYHVKDKSVSTFSGGMRQRFGIAQALLGNPQLIIVDEPTAGLDPEERNRFHDLLSEIGEQVVVILSTHIVQDVSELCPQMAVLMNGKVALQGAPSQLIEDLSGKVWRKAINRNELHDYQQNFQVISKRLLAGKIQIHVLADDHPDKGFELLQPEPEDVYFSVLFGAQSTKEVLSC
ncbi:ABC-type multidrug transport system, ATPase component [Solitalea canadensis DSM 3403]|uniref:ABC-type multidrug transport system, ATPase component n=2 Tax=Solitalea canadensis TaxID=995 RepID=H8KP88_SOLCM|nr:ABC-type multidrug transport system, ATPase component [Solitalea canadensis DSM 3403]